MTSARASNGLNSDIASQTELIRLRYNPHDESVFLQQQAADAKLAMQQTLAELRETAQALSDIPAWTQQYPWLTVGAACAAGFVTSVLLTAPRRRSDEASKPASHASSLTSFLQSTLFTLLRSALMGVVASAIQAQTQPPDAAHSEMSDT
jgi:hypothetical protein